MTPGVLLTTDSPANGTLRRPSAPLSTFEATQLRLRSRLRALPPRRIGAVVLAIVAGGITWSITNAARTSQAQWGDVLGVVVATDDIGPGEELTTSNTEVRALPLAILPPEALTENPTGRLARSSIGAGQIVVASQAGHDRHGLESHRRAVTLPHPLAPPALVDGDIVDLISVRATQSVVLATPIGTGQIVEVDEVGVTVVVDRAVALTLFEALASGSVEFARRTAQG